MGHRLTQMHTDYDPKSVEICVLFSELFASEEQICVDGQIPFSLRLCVSALIFLGGNHD